MRRVLGIFVESVVCRIAGALILQPAVACAQSAGAPAPAFEVAAIRENTTETDGHHHIVSDPGVSRFQTVNLSLRDLIQFAYNKPKSQIIGGPAWLDSTMFDIDAKADAAEDVRYRTRCAPKIARRESAAHGAGAAGGPLLP